jgi:archaellum component FlaC
MNHLGDTNKMVSDTPRMDASAHDDGAIWETGCDIERELNAANVEIDEKRKDIVYLATEKAKLEERINRLEEMYEKEIGENDKFIGTNLQALLTRELNTANQRIKRLEEALEGTVKCFVDLADSGDAGFWNPEEQSVIIAARAALEAKEDKL